MIVSHLSTISVTVTMMMTVTVEVQCESNSLFILATAASMILTLHWSNLQLGLDGKMISLGDSDIRLGGGFNIYNIYIPPHLEVG